MDSETKLTALKYISQAEEICRNNDVFISLTVDPEKYRRTRKAQSDRPSLAGIFDSGSTFIQTGSALFLEGRKKDGTLVHTQAIRSFDLVNESLYDHVNRSRLIYRTPEYHDIDEYTINLNEEARLIRGRVAYGGDAWVSPALRNTDLNLVLGRYGLVLAVMTLDVDHCFAFMSDTNVLRGLHTRAGFRNSGPAIWASNLADPCFYNLVWSSRVQIEEMMQTAPSQTKLRKENPAAKFAASAIK